MPLPLPSSLDTPAATPLAGALRERLAAGRPIRINGADVTRVGQACLQVLASARLSAEAMGIDFAITTPSEELAAAAALLGPDALLPAMG